MSTASLVDACTRKLVADWRYLRENVRGCWEARAQPAAGSAGLPRWVMPGASCLAVLPRENVGARAGRRCRCPCHRPCGCPYCIACFPACWLLTLRCTCALPPLPCAPQAGEPLGRFLDYCTYGHMIDNVVLIVTGTLHERDVQVGGAGCCSLGRAGAGRHRRAARTRRARVWSGQAGGSEPDVQAGGRPACIGWHCAQPPAFGLT